MLLLPCKANSRIPWHSLVSTTQLRPGLLPLVTPLIYCGAFPVPPWGRQHRPTYTHICMYTHRQTDTHANKHKTCSHTIYTHVLTQMHVHQHMHTHKIDETEYLCSCCQQFCLPIESPGAWTLISFFEPELITLTGEEGMGVAYHASPVADLEDFWVETPFEIRKPSEILVDDALKFLKGSASPFL